MLYTPRLPDASLLDSGLPVLKASRVSQVSKHLVKINMHLGGGHRLHPRNSPSVFCPRIVPDRISLTFAFFMYFISGCFASKLIEA